MTALLSSLLGSISASVAVVVLLSSPSLSASSPASASAPTSPAFFAVSLARRRTTAVPDPAAAPPPPSVPFVPARGAGGRGFSSSSSSAAAAADSDAFRPRRTALSAALASTMAMATEEGIYTELDSDEAGADAAEATTIAVPPAASLASSYVVHASSSSEEEEEEDGASAKRDFVFRLYPIDDEGLAGCEGAAAVRALRTPPPPPDDEDSDEEDAAVSYALRCRVEQSEEEEEDGATSIVVKAESGSAENDESESEVLIAVLGRVLVQWAAARSSLPRSSSSSGTTTRVTVSLPDADAALELTAEDVLGDRPAALFSGSLLEELSGGANCEMSEMVDASGSRLGAVPRPLVHKLNLLHRGVGVVVSRDEHIVRRGADAGADDGGGGEYDPPDVYCHRRTSTKRIFPSMYDMFVGGVSTAGERPALTAAREVAEEYGLRRAVEYLEGGGDAEDGRDALSPPLFRCTVCTSYNRCVVTVFTYGYRTDLEEVSWQEEEVDWGDFVPYGIVERAARIDVDRLKEEGRWPGTGYGEAPPLGEAALSADGDGGVSYGNDDEWREWRFVPDGLLVWEAWVAWRDGSGESKSVQ